MKLNEYLIQGNLFTEISKHGDYPFIADRERVLNLILINRYGDRTLYGKFEILPLSEVGEIIATIHARHWKELIDFKDSNINPNLSSSNTITETINETGNRVNTGENLNKVSAYNSDSLIINDGDSSEQNEQLNNEKVRTVTDEKTNYQIAYNNLLLSQKTNIINIVLSDIADFLTLTIY